MVEKPKRKIPLTRPIECKGVHVYPSEVACSDWWTEGPWVDRFERMVAERVGAKYAIAVPNATIGLEMVLKIEEIFADSIYLPAYTHPATALAIIRAGYGLYFCDIDKRTGLVKNFNDNSMPRLFPCFEAVPVSLFGNKTNVEGVIVEDAACSLGTEGVGDDHTCVFSFHPRKIISTGEGGMITTNDHGLAKELRKYKNFGMSPVLDFYEMNLKMFCGTNYKMSDFTGAIGVAQMEILDDVLKDRRNAAQIYDELLFLLHAHHLISFLESYNDASNYQSYVIIVNNRDEVIKRMADRGVETQIGSHCLPTLEEFEEWVDIDKHFPGAEFAASHYLTLPLYYGIKEEDQEYVVNCLTEVLEDIEERRK